MAEPFLSLDARERADILRTLAANSGRSAVILEKDIWVCWVLQALFSMPDPHPMAFKGGTTSTSTTTARQSGSPIRPRSRKRAAMSGARSCWNSAAATSSIRTNDTRSFPTLPP